MEPKTVFCKYIGEEGEAPVSAAQVTEKDVEHVRKYWARPEVVVDDFVVLEGNGGLTIYKPEAFLELYSRPEV